MLTLAPASAATSGKRSLVLRSCNDAPLGKVIAAVGLPLASTVGAVIVAGAVCCDRQMDSIWRVIKYETAMRIHLMTLYEIPEVLYRT